MDLYVDLQKSYANLTKQLADLTYNPYQAKLYGINEYIDLIHRAADDLGRGFEAKAYKSTLVMGLRDLLPKLENGREIPGIIKLADSFSSNIPTAYRTAQTNNPFMPDDEASQNAWKYSSGKCLMYLNQVKAWTDCKPGERMQWELMCQLVRQE